jgi:hypothetical protein
MSYNVKNYTEQGGEVTHIGGKLVIEEGASVEGLSSSGDPGNAFTPAAYQAPSEATTIAALKEDFNTLLAALKAAGLVASEAAGE